VIGLHRGLRLNYSLPRGAAGRFPVRFCANFTGCYNIVPFRHHKLSPPNTIIIINSDGYSFSPLMAAFLRIFLLVGCRSKGRNDEPKGGTDHEDETIPDGKQRFSEILRHQYRQRRLPETADRLCSPQGKLSITMSFGNDDGFAVIRGDGRTLRDPGRGYLLKDCTSLLFHAARTSGTWSAGGSFFRRAAEGTIGISGGSPRRRSGRGSRPRRIPFFAGCSCRKGRRPSPPARGRNSYGSGRSPHPVRSPS